MLNIICGSIAVDSGKILIHGEDITRQKDYIRQRRIGRVYQDPSKATTQVIEMYRRVTAEMEAE